MKGNYDLAVLSAKFVIANRRPIDVLYAYRRIEIKPAFTSDIITTF